MALGISIYPLQSKVEENEVYIRKAAGLGYKRIFTSFLEIDKNKEKALEQVDRYRKLLNLGRELGMEVFVDINPEVLKVIEVDPQDFKFFEELGATGLRLDGAFNGFYEAYLTYNNCNLDIEINGSFDSSYVNSIIDLGGRKNKLLTCHNFYPEEYTGLSLECFLKCNERHKKLSLRTAAFVTSQEGG
ncbi:MAG: MupG family TIM beta-alpha barrel fold protein, partial [Clostridium sp.]